jgi:hypothetical protein
MLPLLAVKLPLPVLTSPAAHWVTWMRLPALSYAICCPCALLALPSIRTVLPPSPLTPSTTTSRFIASNAFHVVRSTLCSVPSLISVR